MEKLRTFLGSKYKIILISAFIAVFLALISILAAKGSYSRYAQDDYCYGYRFKVDNFWNAQVKSYFGDTEYNSNRYSLTFFNGLGEIVGGPAFAPYMPALLMLSWGLILGYLVSLITKDKRAILISTAAALGIVVFSFLLSPNIYQVLFWLSAANTYTTPIIISTFIFARVIHFTLGGKFTWWNAAEVVLLNVVAGGFSETCTAWLLTLWGCLFAVLFLFSRKDLFRKAMWPLLLSVAGTLIAIVLMLVNPTNSHRVSFYQSENLLTGLVNSFSFALLFVKRSLKFSPVPFGFIALFGFWLGTQLKTASAGDWKRKLLQIAGVLVITYVLIASVMAPSVILTASYPGDRMLFVSTFSLILGLFAAGWLTSDLFLPLATRWLSQRVLNGGLILLAVILLGFLGTTFPQAYNKMPLYKARAAAWDTRQQMILQEKTQNEDDLVIPAFDSIYGITEIGSDPHNWVNVCAARYYSVQSITAQDGYMGVGAYPIGK